MAYNSIHKGPQIDQAVSPVLQKESTWDAKVNVPSVSTITLEASGWAENQQTVSVSGVKATGTD